jgi:hypothetical protein
VFVGHFTLDAVLAVVTSATIGHEGVFAAIDSLVSKSMVATRPVGAMMRYRLLDTTRAYALETSIDDVELIDLAVRHAVYYRQWLEQSGTDWPSLSTGAEAPGIRVGYRPSYPKNLNGSRPIAPGRRAHKPPSCWLAAMSDTLIPKRAEVT